MKVHAVGQQVDDARAAPRAAAKNIPKLMAFGHIINLQVRPGMVSGILRIGGVVALIADADRYVLATCFQENLKYWGLLRFLIPRSASLPGCFTIARRDRLTESPAIDAQRFLCT
jgi:hypothetical protein